MPRYQSRLLSAIVFVASSLLAQCAAATFHLWQIDEIYSNASGTVQFVELTALTGGQQFLTGYTLTATQGANTHVFTFATDLPGDTSGRKYLIGTQGFANLNIVTPDYVVPNGFLFLPNGTIDYAGVDTVSYASLPSDGVHSIDRNGTVIVNSPTNFAGATGSIPAPAPPPPPPVIGGTAIPASDTPGLVALGAALAAMGVAGLYLRRRP